MSTPNQAPVESNEQKSFFGVIMHSFFVVPFILAIFCVLLFVAVRILTMEERSVFDYLRDVKEGGLTKRWQSAYELSLILSDSKKNPPDSKFIKALEDAFLSSKNDDQRVQLYLIMAMAKTQSPLLAKTLLDYLPQAKDEQLYAAIQALGQMKYKPAVKALITFLDSSDERIRLAAVVSLGHCGDRDVVVNLKPLLNDPQPNIVWDTAVALAKLGDLSGRGILLSLMNREYLSNYSEVDSQEQTKIMMIALEVTSAWKDDEIVAIRKKLFAEDKNMKVRALAKKILDEKVS